MRSSPLLVLATFAAGHAKLVAVALSATIGSTVLWMQPAARGVGAQSPPQRFVLFELFDSTCPTCVEAGTALDALARRYEAASQPVLCLEYNVDAPEGGRIDRWYAACPAWQDCYLPLELVDSGWRWSCGPKDFSRVYEALVQEAMANPAGAELTAYWTRSGNNLDVSVAVTNLSGITLGADNDASISVIVYERTKVLNTGRYVRKAAEWAITEALPHGVQRRYRLPVHNVVMGRWERAGVAVVVDYRPAPSSERAVALQAVNAIEQPAPTSSPSPTAAPSATRTATPSPPATVVASATPTPAVPTPGSPTAVSVSRLLLPRVDH